MAATASPGETKKAPHIGLILAGLMLGILLAALDQTVVGTSLGKIVADIGGFEHFAWLFSAYMLASTIVIPIAGKLSDIYGRRPIYIAGMVIFLAGSALCGTAMSMTQLIIYRGIQGLGGGAIFPVAIATIADLFAPSDRGRVSGLFGAVFGLSSVVGPFLGGWIVDYVHIADIASWRWVFYVNLPIGITAITFVALFFPRITNKQNVSIDYAGIATLTLGLLSMLLVVVWGGDTYAWASAQIFGLIALSLLSFGAFIAIERRAKDPVIPLTLFKNPVFAVASVVAILAGAAMFTVISFMPTYLQGVVGISATYSGTALIPLSLGLVAGSVISGSLMKKFGYKPFILLGFALVIVGYGLLSTLGVHPAIWVAVLEMIVLGLGIGFTIQTLIVACQNAVERRYLGVATSGITLFRTLGATLGVTALGVVLNRKLQSEIPANVDPQIVGGLSNNPFIAHKVERIPSLLLQPNFRETFIANIEKFLKQPHDQAVIMADKAIEGIKLSYWHGMEIVFIVGAVVAVVALIITAFMKVIPMKSAEEYHGKPGEAAPVTPAFE